MGNVRRQETSVFDGSSSSFDTASVTKGNGWVGDGSVALYVTS